MKYMSTPNTQTALDEIAKKVAMQMSSMLAIGARHANIMHEQDQKIQEQAAEITMLKNQSVYAEGLRIKAEMYDNAEKKRVEDDSLRKRLQDLEHTS